MQSYQDRSSRQIPFSAGVEKEWRCIRETPRAESCREQPPHHISLLSTSDRTVSWSLRKITGQSAYLSTFKCRTPAGTYPIAVDVTATPRGSSKSFQWNPITLARP
jgi:hypothetical protein